MDPARHALASVNAFQPTDHAWSRRKLTRRHEDVVLAALVLVAVNNCETAGVLRGVTQSLQTNPLLKLAQLRGEAVVQSCIMRARFPFYGHLTVLEPRVKVSSTIDWLTARVAADFIQHANLANTLGYRAYLSAHPHDPFALYEHVSVTQPEFPYGALYDAYVVRPVTLKECPGQTS
jgi:hypothetical protein